MESIREFLDNKGYDHVDDYSVIHIHKTDLIDIISEFVNGNAVNKSGIDELQDLHRLAYNKSEDIIIGLKGLLEYRQLVAIELLKHSSDTDTHKYILETLNYVNDLIKKIINI